MALIYKIFGFNFLVIKITPVIFSIITAFFIFKIMQRFSNISGIIAAALFLFSYDTLRASTYITGICMTAMLLVISVYFMFEKKYLLSGIFSGLAGITGLYSLIPIAVISVYLMTKEKKGFIIFIAAFSAIFLTVNLLLMILYGNSYLIPVYKYHLMKPAGESSIIPLLTRLVKTNPLVFLLPLSYFLTSRKKLRIVIYISLAYILFLLLFQKTFGYYFVLIFPFLAMLSAYSITKANFRINKSIVILLLILAITISAVFSSAKFMKYDFQNFNNAEEIANYININSKQGETIFGDDSTTPLLSILSGRRIAFDFADSNSMIFRSGIQDLDKVIAGLKQSGNRFIIVYQLNTGIATGTYGPAYIDEFFDYTRSECTLAKQFKEPWQNYEKVFSIYDCKKQDKGE